MARNKSVIEISVIGHKELIDAQKAVTKYSDALKKAKKDVVDHKNATNAEAQALAHAETNLKKARGEYRQAQKSIKDLAKATQTSGSFTMKMAKAFGVAQLAVDGFKKVSQALANQITDSVKVFADFDIQMQKVKAISGANASEFAKLKQSAQDLGRSTFFTATQVGELQMNFSKLGFTATETLDAQSAALDMATATGEDLARTATVIGSSIRGFALDATEATRVADVMAASFTSSALDLEKFQTSMTKVAPIAELMGVSLEATTAIMGKLSDAGIEASIAGTSLRNIFLKMGDPSSDLSKALGKTIGSGEELVAELKRLRDAGVDVEKMLAVVDQRQVAAFATMVKGVDVIERQIIAFENANGAAAEMAGTVGDALKGAMLRFKSALDGLKIVLVDQIGENLQGVIDKFAVFFNFLAKSAEVPLSEELNKQRIALTTYESKLLDVNTSESERFKLITELKETYPDYLGHLDAETAKNNELKLALKNTNKQLMNKILLQKEDEKIAEQAEKSAERMADLMEREDIIRKEMAKIIEEQRRRVDEDDFGIGIRIANQTYFTLEEGMSLEQQALDLLRQMDAYTVEGTVGSRQKEYNAFSNDVANLQTATKNYNHQIGIGNALEGERLKLMERLGIKLDDIKEKATTTTTNGGGGKSVTPQGEPSGLTPAQQELKDIELQLKQDLLLSEQAFADNTTFTREMLNRDLLELQIMHLEEMTNVKGLEFEVQLDLETKLAKAKGRLRDEDLKATEQTEKAKSELIKANIDNAMAIGSSLTQIGQIMGENSAAAKAGIAITKAAGVASAISGIIDAQGAIAKQAKSGDPYSAFARMAIMAAAVAPLIASLVALKGGGGEGGSTETGSSRMEKLERGGLTRGGMFEGASHAYGGVKFAVGGRIMEAEGGEAIINKRSTAAFKPILSAINSYNGNGVKFADGGLINSGEKFALGGAIRTAQQMVSGAVGGSTKVVVVESDLTTTQNKVSALQSQASF